MGSLKEKLYLEDIIFDWIIILKFVLKIRWKIVAWMSGLELVPMENFCEHGNGSSVSTKYGVYLD